LKKVISLLMSAVLFLSLTACGAKGSSPSEIFADPTNGTEFILQVSVNPKFQLLLDDGGYILELQNLNSDAKKAFKGVDIAGLYCDEGLSTLLAAAHDSGFITEGADIKLTAYFGAGCLHPEDVTRDIENALFAFSGVVSFTYSISAGQYTGGAEDPDFLPVAASMFVTTDGEGRTVTHRQNDAGIDIYQRIEGDGEIIELFFDDEGNLTEELRTFPDGAAHGTLFSGGVIIDEYDIPAEQEIDFSEEYVTTDDDGSIVTSRKNDAGVIVYQHIENGSDVTELFFTDNGDLNKMIVTLPDGASIIEKYYDDGTVAERQDSFPDGMVRITRFAPDGSVTDEVVTGAAGEIVITEPDGSIVTSRKNDAGVIVYQHIENGSDVTELFFDDEGTLIEELRTEAGEVHRNIFVNGIISKGYITFPNGTKVETTYSNGQRLMEESYDPNNGYHQVHTYKNDICISSISNGPDGFYAYWYYDDAGRPTEFLGLDNHSYPVHAIYNPDGSYTSTTTLPDGSTWVFEVDAAGNRIER